MVLTCLSIASAQLPNAKPAGKGFDRDQLSLYEHGARGTPDAVLGAKFLCWSLMGTFSGSWYSAVSTVSEVCVPGTVARLVNMIEATC